MPERIALIGAGVIGKRHLTAMAKVESVELVAIADPLSSAAEIATEHGVPHYSSANEMLSAVAPSGVIIATPTEHHFEPALAALDAGCHLLVEKPIAATVAEAEGDYSRIGGTGLVRIGGSPQTLLSACGQGPGTGARRLAGSACHSVGPVERAEARFLLCSGLAEALTRRACVDEPDP